MKPYLDSFSNKLIILYLGIIFFISTKTFKTFEKGEFEKSEFVGFAVCSIFYFTLKELQRAVKIKNQIGFGRFLALMFGLFVLSAMFVSAFIDSSSFPSHIKDFGWKTFYAASIGYGIPLIIFWWYNVHDEIEQIIDSLKLSNAKQIKIFHGLLVIILIIVSFFLGKWGVVYLK